MGRRLLVTALYSAYPGLADCLLSAIGMLTVKNNIVFAAAPAMSHQREGIMDTAWIAMPHHIKISPM